jgi:hypothetical protein
MAKLYSNEKIVTPKLLPKKETIKFILQYSAALRVIKVGNQKFELIAN